MQPVIAGRTTDGGEAAATATARSVAYALFARLLASPWEDGDPASALPPADLETVLGQLAAALPLAADFESLAGAAARLSTVEGVSGEEMGRAYSGLFEVGSDGPPIPLREGLVAGRPASTREEIVRFYEFFGFDLQADHQWQPDHLSIELEFLHFLAFREAAAGTGERSRALRLGQLDFLDRHLLAWVPAAADRLAELAASESTTPGAGRAARSADLAIDYYAALLRALADFLVADTEWRRATVGGES